MHTSSFYFKRPAARSAWWGAVWFGLLAAGAWGEGTEGGLRDTRADSWVASDALGRVLPDLREVGPARADRTVGLFYFLWLGAHEQGGLFDISKILAANPQAMSQPEDPRWGPRHVPHHWGESRFGYYRSDDRWVLRRHAQMLADAGVDTLIFDVTNQVTYAHEYHALLEVFAEVRAAGGRTPQVAFLCPFGSPAKVVRELWRDLYAPRVGEALWFRWKGKPLILADEALLGDAADPEVEAIRKAFSFRKPQPDYFQGPGAVEQWAWLEVSPQHVFRVAGVKEQMAVGVAQNAVGGRLGSMSEVGARGRSFHGGAVDRRPGAVRLGLNVAEQWERARREDPLFVFVTGWNEWIAGRYDEFNGVRLPVMFVDQFDQEHSRDIEPMRGGHGDDYYYQLVGDIRRYKGVRAGPALGARQTVDLAAGFAQWEAVRPILLDDAGDTAPRDHLGYAGHTRYVNRSGRNDIVAAQVARDERSVYFHVQTRALLTDPAEPGWMFLLMDGDGRRETGWEGYETRCGGAGAAPGTVRLERWGSGGWEWLRDIPRVWQGRDLQVAVPREDLALAAGREVPDFKWVDHQPEGGTALDFMDQGDAAPNGRFNWRLEPEGGAARPAGP